MRVVKLVLALLATVMPMAASATVAPLTPEGRIAMARQDAFEDRARRAYGQDIIERLRDWRITYGSILVGDEGVRSTPRLLVKDELGWAERLRNGSLRRLPLALSTDIDRQIAAPTFWYEIAYQPQRACRGRARLMVVRHAGRDLFMREPCGSRGRSGRVADIAERLRLPNAPFVPAQMGPVSEEMTLSRTIFSTLSDQAAAFERRLLAGFVDPYAADAVVELPEGKLQGKAAIARWARGLQDWTAPGIGQRRSAHAATIQPQQGDTLYTTHEVRWEEGGRALRQTYSERWRDDGGLWQIVHQRVSPVKPVTDRRP